MTSSTTHLPGPYRLTVADWLNLEHSQGLHEIIDGELFMAPSPSIAHQRVSRELEFRIYTVLRETGGGEVFNAPTGVRLDDDTVLEPDLLVVLTENSERVRELYIDGAPDLVVEILSPGTAGRDLGTKRQHYETAGVREYWIVDPQTESVEILVLQQGSFARVDLFRRGDVLHSPLLPELTFPLEAIWSAA